MLALKKIKSTILKLSILFSLFSQITFAQTIISGSVSGKWIPDNSPYYICGDVCIDTGDVLVIEAGVEVVFVGTYSFTIDGLLKANGVDSNKVTFHGHGIAGSWKWIYFSEKATEGCVLNYCAIQDGGLEDYGSIYISDNDSSVTISNCEIYNSASYGILVKSDIYTNGGDYLKQKCKPIIANNSIHHNNRDGIYVFSYYNNAGSDGNYNTCISSPLIKNNIIYANFSNGVKCYVYANGSNNWSKDTNPIVQANPIIQQNTIYGNKGCGIFCSKTVVGYFDGVVIIEANPIITSNIISNNKKGGICNETNENNIILFEKIKFNDFWANTNDDLCGIEGYPGKLIKININGDSCDFNWNIFFDPEFVDESNQDFHLKSTSQCINAGDLSLGWDPDSTFPDIGALFYDPDYDTSTDVISFKESQFNFPLQFILNQNYPNPFNPVTSISFQVPKTSHIKIEVFNILGQHIRNLVDEEKALGNYQIMWNGIDDQGQAVSSGVYLYKMQAGDFTAMKKMVLVR